MFSKIKHGFDRKAKRLVALMLAASMLCGIAGCTKEPSESPADINDTSIELSNDNDEIGFDIDRVRKISLSRGKRLKFPLNSAKYPRVGATSYMTRMTFTFGKISSWQQCITTEMKCILPLWKTFSR